MPDMTVPVITIPKTFLAKTTLVRFLPGMSQNMSLQFIIKSENLRTHRTSQLFFRFLHHKITQIVLGFQVTPQRLPLFVLNETDVTTEVPLVGMAE